MIEVHHLQKQFGAVAALRTFRSWRRRRNYRPCGANGAGKSTTSAHLRSAETRGGQVRVDGISPADDPLALQRRVGGLLDHAGLYSRLTRVRPSLFRTPARIPVGALVNGGGSDRLPRNAVGGDRPTLGFSQGERMKTAWARPDSCAAESRAG